MGGDHSITLPILRALVKKYGPMGMVHIDAHADANDLMFGETVTHGTPFRRAVEEGLVHGPSVAQNGLAPPAIAPRISTGRAARASAWSRPRSAGTSP